MYKLSYELRFPRGVAYAMGLYAQDLTGRNGVPEMGDRTRHVLTKP